MSQQGFAVGDIVMKNDGEEPARRHRGSIFKVLGDDRYRVRWVRGWAEREYLDENFSDLILVKRTVSTCGGQSDKPYVAPAGFLDDIREKHHGD